MNAHTPRDAAPQARHASARMLTIGTWLASAIIFCGLALVLHAESGTSVRLAAFAPDAEATSSPIAIGRAALSLRPRGVLALGVLVLILTPLARVVLCAALFARARDAMYALISLAVCAWLVLALAGVMK